MKRGFADTDKGQIYFYEQGEGPVLILLHPSPQSGRVYWRLAPELAQTFRVIVPDTLGFGLSDYRQMPRCLASPTASRN